LNMNSFQKGGTRNEQTPFAKGGGDEVGFTEKLRKKTGNLISDTGDKLDELIKNRDANKKPKTQRRSDGRPKRDDYEETPGSDSARRSKSREGIGRVDSQKRSGERGRSDSRRNQDDGRKRRDDEDDQNRGRGRKRNDEDDYGDTPGDEVEMTEKIKKKGFKSAGDKIGSAVDRVKDSASSAAESFRKGDKDVDRERDRDREDRNRDETEEDDRPRGNRATEKIKDAQKEIKATAIKNLETAMERGTKIEVLVDDTEKLAANAKTFEKKSVKLKRKMCVHNLKMTAVLIIVVAAII